MPAYRVTRDIEAVLTVHASTEGAAFGTAREELAEGLASLSADVTFDERETSVYEHPTAPFEPYRVAVDAETTVTIDAANEDTAVRRAEGRIEAVFADLEPAVDEWSFADDPAVEPAE